MAGLKGAANVNATFSTEQVVSIRKLAEERDKYGRRVWSAAEIARQYSSMGVPVSTECIRRIIRRETWAHVPVARTAEEVAQDFAAPMTAEMKMQADASLARLLKMQEDGKGQKLLDELTGGSNDGVSRNAGSSSKASRDEDT